MKKTPFSFDASITSTAADVDKLNSLLIKYEKELSEFQKRAVSAIVGAAVADAATRPFHWVYHRNIMEQALSNPPSGYNNVDEIAFWPVSVSPYYTLPTGRRSCYNDESLLMLRALSDVGIQSSCEQVEASFIQYLLQMFSPQSEYAIAYQRRNEPYDPAK
jgi:hypothetical protein